MLLCLNVVVKVPSKFPELERLSEAQLERLLSDDVALKVSNKHNTVMLVNGLLLC